MNRHDDTLPPEVEADVAALLTRALRGGADGPAADEPVDVSAVVAGTRRGIVRAAVRRRVAVASAAVAAVAVPVAVVLLGPGGTARSVGPALTASSTATGSATTTPTAGLSPVTTTPTTTPTDVATGSPAPDPTSAPATGPSSTPEPSAPQPVDPQPVKPPAGVTVVPIASLPSDGDPRHVAYLVPDGALLRASDFPTKVVRLSADFDADYRWTPTVSGQGCGSATAPMPVAARQMMWAQENSNRLDQLSATVVVSGWIPGTTAARFADISQNDGVCKWGTRPTPVSTAGMPGDEAWAATFGQNGLAVGRAASRIGDVIVSVEVYHPKGRAAAVALAKKLVGVAAGRVVSTGLAVTAANGG